MEEPEVTQEPSDPMPLASKVLEEADKTVYFLENLAVSDHWKNRVLGTLKSLVKHAEDWREATETLKMDAAALRFDRGTPEYQEIASRLEATWAEQIISAEERVAVRVTQREQERYETFMEPLVESMVAKIEEMGMPGDLLHFQFKECVGEEQVRLFLSALKKARIAADLPERQIIYSRIGTFSIEVLSLSPKDVVLIQFPEGTSEQHQDGIPVVLQQALLDAGLLNRVVNVRSGKVSKLNIQRDDTVVVSLSVDFDEEKMNETIENITDTLRRIDKFNPVIGVRTESVWLEEPRVEESGGGRDTKPMV